MLTASQSEMMSPHENPGQRVSIAAETFMPLFGPP